MDAASGQFPWFHSRAGRRYSLQLALVVLAKLIALTILYFALITPQPRADTSPAAVQHHLLDTPSTISGAPP